ELSISGPGTDVDELGATVTVHHDGSGRFVFYDHDGSPVFPAPAATGFIRAGIYRFTRFADGWALENSARVAYEPQADEGRIAVWDGHQFAPGGPPYGWCSPEALEVSETETVVAEGATGSWDDSQIREIGNVVYDDT